MEKITSFLELAEYILKSENQALNEKEIWNIAQQKILIGEISFKTEGLTPWQTIGARIYMDMKHHPETTKFVGLIKPKRFILKAYTTPLQQKFDTLKDEKDTIFKERDLHAYLTLWNSQKRIYSKTIFHEVSKKNKVKNGGLKDHWLYPDMVGVKFAFNYETEVQNFANRIAFSLVKIFSYELKLKITPNNVREYYFQAVSNSSWAHEGYLVVNEIEGGDSLLDELIRLNNAFGIGVILLNNNTRNKSVIDSEIILPAKEKDYIDMETLDLLAKKNQNFKDFIKAIDDSLQIKQEQYLQFDEINENLLEFR